MSKKNKNAQKIFKRLDRACPDCDAHKLVIIGRKKEVDGVVYLKKYIYCQNCEFEAEYKEKGKNKKLEFEEI